MPKAAKVLFHTRRLVSFLSITAATENAVDLLVKSLCDKYREYTLEPLDVLRDAVSIALKTIMASPDIPQSTVMSLNQIVSNQYRGTPSKRQRPVEVDDIENDNLDDFGVDDKEFSMITKRSTPIDSLNPPVESAESRSVSKLDNLPREVAGDNYALASSSKKRVRSRGQSGKSDSNLNPANPPNSNDVEADIVDAIMSKGHRTSSEFLVPRPSARISDLAGIDSITSQVKELVFYPVLYSKLYNYLGVQPPCGLLLHGPSGCGKTALAYAIAGELGLPFFKASGPELIGGTSGESEERIRDIFLAAAAKAPSVLFVDALDVIAGKKDSAQRGMDRRIVAQLFDSIDSIISLGEDNLRVDDENLNPINSSQYSSAFERAIDVGGAPGADGQSVSKEVMTKKGLVVLIAATNKADALDAGVRGRFSRELSLPVPDAPSRTKILTLMTARMKLAGDVDLTELGRITPGFVGSDLKTLTREAGMLAVSRIVQHSPEVISGNDDPLTLKYTVFESAVDKEVTQAHVRIDSAVEGSVEGIHPPALTRDNQNGSERIVVNDGHAEVATELSNDITKEETSAQTLSHSSLSSVEQIVVTCASQPTESSQVASEAVTVAVGMCDFINAAKSVQPTAKREGFAVVPDVTWGDVGALAEVREELLHNVLEPIAHPERFRALGLEVPAGVLFFGPPGCGKTLLAKALANQSGANFISVKGPELLNMYVGESESRVRQVFSRARASAPCVIFFDELDALCPRRGSGSEGGSGVSERVVNQLLTELDGLETRKDVYIIAATNRLELIDEAMLRPGRLGKLLYVPLPDASDRISILKALVRKVSIDRNGVDIAAIGGDPRTEGFSGADMAALVREAGLAVVRELMSSSHKSSSSENKNIPNGSSSSGFTGPGSISERAPGGLEISTSIMTVEGGSPKSHSSSVADAGGSVSVGAGIEEAVCICSRHFESALQRVRPSVALQERKRYERVQQNIKDGMGAIQALSAAAMSHSSNR